MTNNGRWAYVVENQTPISNLQDNLIRYMCDYEEVADTILHVAEVHSGKWDEIGFREKHEERLEKAYAYTQSLNWTNVCKSWIEYFKNTY
jgi:hypothetical protein